MKVEFLGVGEAFDCDNPNTSFLINSDTKLLVDCGFTTFHELTKVHSDCNYLDAIYISHFHGDHVASLPALFLWLWEEGREKELKIICQENVREKIEKLLDLVYEGFKEKFKYEINYIVVKEGEKISFNELALSFAYTVHSTNNLAVRIEKEGKGVCYSGDGMFNEKTLELYKGSSLVVQETYLFDEEKIGHASIVKTIEKIDAQKIALIHINRQFRREKLDMVKSYIEKSGKDVIIPENGEVVEV